MRAVRPTDHRGFSVLESMMACVLSTILVGVSCSAWIAFENAAAEVIARCDLAQEADLALAQLADDLRGATSGRPDTFRIEPGYDPELGVYMDPVIRYDDLVIQYEVVDGSLLRRVNPPDGGVMVLARHIERLAIRADYPMPGVWEFSIVGRLPVRERGQTDAELRRVFHLIAVMP